MEPRWRKPGPVGGRLIRKVISSLRQVEPKVFGAPIKRGKVVVAFSGGLDSTALAHLLVHYGKRVVSPENLLLLHVDHGWRGKASQADARWVEKTARNWGVACEVVTLPPSARPHTGESWEEAGRRERKKIFGSKSKKRDWILTAHHADDLVETVLWRICTGAAQTHGAGILPKEGRELRPLLEVSKSELQAYLEEEGQSWRHDASNDSPRFLRNQIRNKLLPELEKVFPQVRRHLLDLALRAAGSAMGARRRQSLPEAAPLAALFGSLAIRPRKIHWEQLKERTEGNLSLEGGWSLQWSSEPTEKWILTRSVSA